jgi:LCP family protein required for cell wall assembly
MKRVLKSIIFTMVALLIGLLIFAGKIYHDISSSMSNMYADASPNAEQASRRFVNLQEKEPFSVLFLGVDSVDMNTTFGRSDSMSILTINPAKKTTQVLSIPRDTYTMISGKNVEGKINEAHAYGGVSASIDTVEDFIGLPINHYVSLDMTGMVRLVDIVGGVTVNNPFEFSYQGKTFKQGENFLNGEEALKYSRMRKEDPQGDYGRQERQRQVIESIGQKLFNIKMLTHYQKVLSTLETNMRTDFTFLDMKSILFNYSAAMNNVESLQLVGTGYDKDNLAYQQIAPEELEQKKAMLQNNLE